MKKQTIAIHNYHLANELLEQGFPMLKIVRNKKYKRALVFVFENGNRSVNKYLTKTRKQVKTE